MKDGGEIRKTLAAIIAFTIVSSAFSAVDPLLTLGSPNLTNNTFGFILNGQFGFRYIVEASTDLQTWHPVLTNDGPDYSRSLALSTFGDHAFYRASQGPFVFSLLGLVAQSNIVLSGNNVSLDSFNSSDTNSFPGGQWNATNRSANGDIATGYGLLDVENAKIMGRAITGSGSISLGPNGSVGDVPWVTGLSNGIEPGWYATNIAFVWPDVAPPYSTGVAPTGNGTNTYFLSSGNYLINGNLLLNSGQDLLVDSWQFAQLYVTGNVQMSGSASIIVRPGARLVLYVGGTSATLTQVNNSGTPVGFTYYGLPSNTNITCASSGNMIGTIYAPEANLAASGGGATGTDFQGAWILNTVNINGHVDFHVDVSFARATVAQ